MECGYVAYYYVCTFVLLVEVRREFGVMPSEVLAGEQKTPTSTDYIQKQRFKLLFLNLAVKM